MNKNWLPVVCVVENDEFYFEKSHHYHASPFEDGTYKIIDSVGRGEITIVPTSYFQSHFITIEEGEFAKYEGFSWEGYTKEIEIYLKELSSKYNIAL